MSTFAKILVLSIPDILIVLFLVAFFLNEQRKSRKFREALRSSLPAEMQAIMKRGYLIRSDGSAITCITCGMTSYNRNDVTNKYCGHCKKFHEG